jgi:hypothetical protein
MMEMKTLQRELRVAFSLRTQPLWLRLLKWSVFITITMRYRNRVWFPYGASLALFGGIALHMFYRWKTRGWRQAWGGWSDLPDRP